MFTVDAMSRTPIYEQLTDQIERFILCGVLTDAQQLPSVRALSSELSVNPNTIQKAYADLCARQVLCSVPGKGCFVAMGAKARLQKLQRGKLDELGNLLHELKLAGIDKADVQAILETVYPERSETECCV